MTEGTTNNTIRVLVVDDSVMMGVQIAKILSSDRRLDVVGRAKDGVEALKMIAELKPDVVTLDVEMPRMDGITCLKHIMVRHPVPTIMVSSLTREGAKTTFECLRYGALDFIAKPSRLETASLASQSRDIITRVRRAARIGVRRIRYQKKPSSDPLGKRRKKGPADRRSAFICIGAGSGAYYALLQIVPHLPADFEDVIIAVTYVAPRFLEPFVSYLESCSALPVRSISESSEIEKGCCYVGSAFEGARLTRGDEGRIVFDFPSPGAPNSTEGVDEMLQSAANLIGRRAVAVIMSGPGKDGAKGFTAVRNAGGLGVIQDVRNCMNPSMPRAALEAGHVDKIIPDYHMADFLTGLNHSGESNAVPVAGASAVNPPKPIRSGASG